jgi:hypothetical protein
MSTFDHANLMQSINVDDLCLYGWWICFDVFSRGAQSMGHPCLTVDTFVIVNF